MHYFCYQKSRDTLDDALRKYPWLFELDLSDESREVRYRALEFLWHEYGYSGIIERDPLGWVRRVLLGDRNQLYLSFSHSRDHVAFACSHSPVGIDVAEYALRDSSLLLVHPPSDYQLLGGANWYNFYTLWTAKESIIKLEHLLLDTVKEIQLLSVSEDVLIFGLFKKKLSYPVLFQTLSGVLLAQNHRNSSLNTKFGVFLKVGRFRYD